jgi:hypothetical protein
LKIKEFNFGYTNVFFICQIFYKVEFTCLSHNIISDIVSNALEESATPFLYAEFRGRRFVHNFGNCLYEAGFEVPCDVAFRKYLVLI